MMVRRTAADAQQTRRGLLGAALEVFSDCGFAAARVEDIAARAGVTRGAFYHHFRDKAELYDAILRDEAQRALDPVVAELSGDAAPLERLRRFLLSFGRAVEGDARLRMILELLLFGDTGAPERTKQLTGQGFRAWSEVFVALLREAHDRGELRAGLGPEAAAAATLTVAVGFTTAVLRAPGVYPAGTSADGLFDLLLDGIAQ
ncbi:MAG TPA: TetR family transcriptional regulator [Aldersonia sp.]